MKPAVKPPSTGDIDAAASAWIAHRDAGMTAAEEKEFTRWTVDPRHAAALARHEQTWKIFEQPMAAGRGRALADEFRARLARQRRRRVAATLAAASCLLVAGFVWRSTVAERTAPAPGANAFVVLPEKRTLPDGSVVELKSGAKIAINFTGKFRRVSLQRGEAHFEVAKNVGRPFIVAVAGVEVRAVGTAFSVELGQKTVAILVTEGQVAVNSEHGERKTEDRGLSVARPAGNSPTSVLRLQSADVLIDAGNRLVVELAPLAPAPPAAVPVSAPEVAERLAWRAPRLEFTGAPLADAVALMNRYNRVQFVIDDPALRGLEVSGYFRADNYETFLGLIEPGLGLKSERHGDKIVLRKAP